VSKHQGMLKTARCRMSRETMRDASANAQPAGRRSASRMQINRSCAPLKRRIREIHLRQNLDQHDQTQQAHQDRQTRPAYRPALHGTEGNTIFSSVKPHESATRLRTCIVDEATNSDSRVGLTPPATRSCWHRLESARRSVPMPPGSAVVPDRPPVRCDSPARS